MKHLYRTTVALIVLGFIGTTVFLMLAPDIIPAHYNSAGVIDRMGSKYEYILLPIISAGAGGIFLLLAKQARIRKWNSYALTEKIFLATAIFEVLLLHYMGASAMWTATHYFG